MPDALRADFRAHYGMRLSDAIEDDPLEAADLAAHLPPDGRSAAFRAVNPETWRWGVQEHLSAGVLDSLRWLQWAKSKDAQKNRNQPKPIKRPGMEDKAKADGRFKDVRAVPLGELKRLLSMPRYVSK